MTLVSGKTFSIDDATKEVWDRSTAPVIKDTGTPIAAADILNFDYLFGQVTFVATFTPSGAVTADVDFFPLTVVGSGNAYSLSMSAAVEDISTFALAQANTGYTVSQPGLRTVSLEVSGIYNSTENAAADLSARNELIIEIDPAGDGSSIARGFFKVTTAGQGGAVGALEDETINFMLTVPDDAKVLDVFNWRHTATTLSTGIQKALTSWLTEADTFKVQYLPSGVLGESPLDGKQGTIMVSDISLSGGLNNMNVFNIEMIDIGVYTEV